MGWITGIAIYGVLWWMVLFTVLPFGVHGQRESGGIAWGTDPGAPRQHAILRKMLITTLLTGVVWLILYGLTASGAIGLDSFGFLPDPGRPLED